MAHGGLQVDRRRARSLFAVVALAVVALDQITKHLSVVNLEGQEPVRLLGGAVYLTVVRNAGAAFSMGTGYTWVFPMIAAAVVVGIFVMMRSVRSWPWALALGLVLAGAVGNLGDRLFRAPAPFLGHVVDMVSVFDERGRVFPVFNVADSALCVGVAVIVLLELTGRRRDGTREPAKGDGTQRQADEPQHIGGGTVDEPATGHEVRDQP